MLWSEPYTGMLSVTNRDSPYRYTDCSTVFARWRPHVSYVIHRSIWANAHLHPKRHLDRFSRFAGLTVVINTQTDRQTDLVATARVLPMVGSTGTLHVNGIVVFEHVYQNIHGK